MYLKKLMDKVHSCEINLLLPSLSGDGVVRRSLLMRTPLCGRRLLKTLKGRKHMAVGSMLIHLSISEDEKEPRKFFFLCVLQLL